MLIVTVCMLVCEGECGDSVHACLLTDYSSYWSTSDSKPMLCVLACVTI